MEDVDDMDVSDAASVDYFASLPEALVIAIFEVLAPDIAGLCRCRIVCKRFQDLVADDAVWRKVGRAHFGLNTPTAPSDGATKNSFLAAVHEWFLFRCVRVAKHSCMSKRPARA